MSNSGAKKMAKPSCETLVTMLEAVELHDAAHREGSERLHSLATKLMSISGVKHLSIGTTLDDGEDYEPPLLVFSSVEDVPRDLLDCGLYDVCLLRRTDESAIAGGAMIVGGNVSLVPPLESGSRKFPVVATPYDVEARVEHVGEDGGALPVGVWVVSGDEGAPTVHDCLVRGVEQVHKLPLTDRLSKLPASFRDQVQYVERPSGLCDLPAGRWLLRTACEPCFDVSVPLGLLYDAQVVRPGQYVRPPKPSGSKPDGETIIQRLPHGLRCQLHKREYDAWLFIGDGPVDCIGCLPQAEKALADSEVSSVVLDCILVPDTSAASLSDDIRRGNKRPKVGLRFVAFDCLYCDGEDLHELPLEDRVARLGLLNLPSGVEQAQVIESEEPGALIRDAEGTYPLDWSNDGWHRIPEEPRKPVPPAEKRDRPTEREPKDEPDRELGLSREWFNLPEAETEVPFWLEDGVLSVGVPFSEEVLRLSSCGVDSDRIPSGHLSLSQEPEKECLGRAIVGVQRDDMHEVFLVFGDERERSGRYLWQWSDEAVEWRCWKPKNQVPYLSDCDADEEVRDAMKRNGWIAWNAGAMRLLNEHEFSCELPLNWEATLEDFEYLDNADFSEFLVQVRATNA